MNDNDEQSTSMNERENRRQVRPLQELENFVPRTYKGDDNMPIIWLDPNVHEGNANLALQKQLNEVTKSFQVLADDEECEEYIRHLPVGEQIILIVAGSIGSVIIPLVHDSTQLKVIYIYSYKEQYYKKKFKNYKKVSTFVRKSLVQK